MDLLLEFEGSDADDVSKSEFKAKTHAADDVSKSTFKAKTHAPNKTSQCKKTKPSKRMVKCKGKNKATSWHDFNVRATRMRERNASAKFCRSKRKSLLRN